MIQNVKATTINLFSIKNGEKNLNSEKNCLSKYPGWDNRYSDVGFKFFI